MVEKVHPIHNYVHSERVVVPDTMAHDDLDYWRAQGFNSDEIPEKIILATASTRKLIMAYALLNDFDFPHPASNSVEAFANPLALQEFLQQHIFNGDGSYKGEEILLGVYHGVAVYGRSTGGETPGNNPVTESLNKVTHALNQYYRGKNVVIIAGDAVDCVLPDVDDLGEVEYLGKPANLPNFPREDASREQIDAFLEEYFIKHYPPDHRVLHVMAYALAYGSSDRVTSSEVSLERNTTSQTLGEIDPHQLDTQAGGAGVMQRMVDWEQEFADVPDADSWRWVVYCTIVGMPVFSMLGAIRNLAKPDPYQRA